MRCKYCRRPIAPKTGHHPTLVSQQGFAAEWRCEVKGVALEPVSGCAECGGPLATYGSAQLPLLRHGDYGAVTLNAEVYCAVCGWSRGSQVDTLNPRRPA